MGVKSRGEGIAFRYSWIQGSNHVVWVLPPLQVGSVLRQGLPLSSTTGFRLILTPWQLWETRRAFTGSIEVP